MKISKRVVGGKSEDKKENIKKNRKSQTRALLRKEKKKVVIKNERNKVYKELKVFWSFSAELLDTMSLLALNCETFLIRFLTGN